MKDIVRFFNEVKIELSKVIWPKWDEFVGSVIVVLFLVVVFAIYLWTIDFGLSKAMSYIFKFYRRF